MKARRHSVPYLRSDCAGQRTVYVSAAAAVLASPVNDLYVDGEVLALVSAPEGEYTLNKKPHTNAKVIDDRNLVYYLKTKFPGRPTLTAWADPAHGALLFGAGKRRPLFDRDTFRRLDLDPVSPFRRSLASRNYFYVTKLEPRCCVPLVSGDCLYLKKDGKRGLRRFDEAPYSFYKSNVLAAYCKGRWRDRDIFKRTFDGGVLLSPDFSFLAETTQLPQDLEELPLEAGGLTLGIGRDHSVRLSQDAYELLGGHVDVYLSHSSVALQPARHGALRFRRCADGASAFSLPLTRMILAYYPMAEELQLKAYEDLYVLSTGREDFSPRDYYFRVALEEQKQVPALTT